MRRRAPRRNLRRVNVSDVSVAFAKRNQTLRQRGAKRLKSLGAKLTDFAGSFRSNDLTAFCFRSFSHAARIGVGGRRNEVITFSMPRIPEIVKDLSALIALRIGQGLRARHPGNRWRATAHRLLWDDMDLRGSARADLSASLSVAALADRFEIGRPYGALDSCGAAWLAAHVDRVNLVWDRIARNKAAIT
jgi:hypothetical protein